MYLELLTTVTAVQQDLANAYVASDRMQEVGLYFLAINYATAAFFDQVTPPPKCEHLHEEFLKWQKLGIKALSEEMEAGKSVNSQTSRLYAEASQKFADAFAAFVKEAQQNASQE